jgi:hypothetical protein
MIQVSQYRPFTNGEQISAFAPKLPFMVEQLLATFGTNPSFDAQPYRKIPNSGL